MKNLARFLLILTISFQVHATQQQPDYLYYKEQKLRLNTGWGHPSPLETYYSQNNIQSPFKMLHTANYRGHVATWEIKSDKLFLKKISVGGKQSKPEEFHVKSHTSQKPNSEAVFADWFSGVIEASLIVNSDSRRKYIKTYYIQTQHGNVIDLQAVTRQDSEMIDNHPKDKELDSRLTKIKNILKLNHDYISYYYRLRGADIISFEGRQGILSSKTGYSPILSYYHNDHMKWPFNWENRTKNGAPQGRWSIIGDRLYLDEVSLITGLGLYEVEELSLEVNELFGSRFGNGQVLAEWVSGVFVIKVGIEPKKEDIGVYREFEVSEYIYLNLKQGYITESYKVKKDFDFKNIPEDTLPELKVLIEQFKE